MKAYLTLFSLYPIPFFPTMEVTIFAICKIASVQALVSAQALLIAWNVRQCIQYSWKQSIRISHPFFPDQYLENFYMQIFCVSALAGSIVGVTVLNAVEPR